MLMKKYLIPLLIITMIILGYSIYRQIAEPLEFKKRRDQKYIFAIKRLMEIRDAQNAYKKATGKFTGSYDTLTNFIDTGFFIKYKNLCMTSPSVMKNYYFFNVSKKKQIIQKIEQVKIKDSFFRKKNYTQLKYYPVGAIKKIIPMKINYINNSDSTKKGNFVFLVAMRKSDILKGEDENAITVEENTKKGIVGKFITVGDTLISSSQGNWTKNYEIAIHKEHQKIISQ